MKSNRNGTGIYVFCITDGDPIASGDRLHPFRSVLSIGYQDLVAVVSQVPLKEFGEKALRGQLDDLRWLEREVRAHEQVIEKVMGSRTVLPMKFCTIFRTERKVRSLLDARQEEFRSALARLREKEEWEVKVYFEPDSPAARPPASPTPTTPSGRDYLLKKKAEYLNTWEMMDKGYDQAQQSFEKLADCVDEIQLKPVDAQSSSSHPRLILDAVCLLAKPDLPAFRHQLESLSNELATQGFRFDLSGPWPAYHFVTEAEENVITA